MDDDDYFDFVSAINTLPDAKEPPNITKTLKDRSLPSLEKTKESLRTASNSRMRVTEHYLCDECSQPIMNENDGFVIHGNIYVANPSCRGGLIGNNFPNVKDRIEPISVTDVKENVFCTSCFLKILGISAGNALQDIKQVAERALRR